MMEHAVGIDIGSSSAKVVVLGPKATRFVVPTGWSSKNTAAGIEERLAQQGILSEGGKTRVVSTGYGRNAVEYADKRVTEITCHARGGLALAGGDCGIIDIGGQDTKVIRLENGAVADFLMNDKCAAGTGKFIEIMANRLDVDIDSLFSLAEQGTPLPLSSLCTVFAESEIISYIGEGKPREDIAAGVASSVAAKVATLCSRQGLGERVLFTGGLSHISFFANVLGSHIGRKVLTADNDGGRYAGALGAALIAQGME